MSKSIPDDLESLNSGSDESAISIHDIATVPPGVLDEDTFGMTVCSLARDSYFIARQEQGGKDVNTKARYFRLITTSGLCLLTIAVQLFLLYYVKKFISARAVHDIRIAYDLYETTIYGAVNCTLTVNGKHRGDLTKFDPSLEIMKARLATLDPSDQDDICRIPMSQPYFFGVILAIWTSTCLLELRKALVLFLNLVHLPIVSSMSQALHHGEGEDGVLIVGLTMIMKVIFVLLLLFRFGITLFLLWVGCRWLLATTAFCDLILNAVALEFILLLKEGFYHAFVPIRNKLDIGITAIQPYRTDISASTFAFVTSTGMIFVVVLWVVLYMLFFQQVLPGYNWDVREACEDFIAKRFEV